MNKDDYCYSAMDDGPFAESFEEACEHAWDYCFPDEVTTLQIFRGKARPCSISAYVPTRRIIDDLQEAAYEDVGEFGEAWLEDLTNEQVKDLEKHLGQALSSWANKHNLQPHFWAVDSIKEIEVKRVGECEFELVAEQEGVDDE